MKAHVTVILRKLGVRSRTQAVIEARGLAIPPAEPIRPKRARAIRRTLAHAQQRAQRGGLDRLVQQLDLVRAGPERAASDRGRR